MSFAEMPQGRSYRTFVSLIYTFIGFFVIAYSLINALIGRCDSDGCMPWLNYLVFQFPGPIVAILVGGVAVYRWASR